MIGYFPHGGTTVKGEKGEKGEQGERGPMGAGSSGPKGPPGSPGARGSIWQPSGSGPPTSFPDQQDGDLYLDVDSDEVYQLESGVWTLVGDFTGTAGPPGPPGPPGPSTGPAGGVLSGSYPNPGFAVDMATQAELDAEATLARNADNLTSGTVADARIPSGITRDSELATVATTGDYDDLTDKPTSLPPSGAAGGVLSGTYPNPGFAVDMATQAELDAKVTDAIVDGVTTVAPSQNAVFDALALKAPLASPALTGNPTAPTPSPGDNDTSIATTAFVTAADTALVVDSIADADTTHAPSRNAVFDALALKAPLASPTFTGTVTISDRIAYSPADQFTASGAVTIDSSAAVMHRIVLSGNITSTTISNATLGGLLMLLIGTTTGSETMVWPTNTRFNGGLTPVLPAPATFLCMQFVYESITARWVELSRTTVATT